MKPSIKKSEVDLERFEERAAIIEYDGKLPRTEAERLAREEQDRVYLSQDLTLLKSSK